MSATTNNCGAHSATTIGTASASASGITSKHRAWNLSPLGLPYKFYAQLQFCVVLGFLIARAFSLG